jgi:uncharacterized protein YkwD
LKNFKIKNSNYFQGKVVTETTTEYKEITDDSDFGNFGSSSSGFPDSDPKWKEVKRIEADRKSGSASSSSEDESEDNFEEESLKAHNLYRAKHGVQPLKLDKKVNKNNSLIHYFV